MTPCSGDVRCGGSRHFEGKPCVMCSVLKHWTLYKDNPEPSQYCGQGLRPDTTYEVRCHLCSEGDPEAVCGKYIKTTSCAFCARELDITKLSAKRWRGLEVEKLQEQKRVSFAAYPTTHKEMKGGEVSQGKKELPDYFEGDPELVTPKSKSRASQLLAQLAQLESQNISLRHEKAQILDASAARDRVAGSNSVRLEARVIDLERENTELKALPAYKLQDQVQNLRKEVDLSLARLKEAKVSLSLSEKTRTENQTQNAALIEANRSLRNEVYELKGQIQHTQGQLAHSDSRVRLLMGQNVEGTKHNEQKMKTIGELLDDLNASRAVCAELKNENDKLREEAVGANPEIHAQAQKSAEELNTLRASYEALEATYKREKKLTESSLDEQLLLTTELKVQLAELNRARRVEPWKIGQVHPDDTLVALVLAKSAQPKATQAGPMTSTKGYDLTDPRNLTDATEKETTMTQVTDTSKKPLLQKITESRALAVLKVDATDAAWRTAGSQFVKLTKEPLIALLTRHLGPNDESTRAKLAAFLDTELGSALLSAILATGLSAIPGESDAVPAMMGRELRVRALTGAGDAIADVLMGPLREVVVMYLQATAPADPPTLVGGNPTGSFNVVDMRTQTKAG